MKKNGEASAAGDHVILVVRAGPNFSDRFPLPITTQSILIAFSPYIT